MRRILFLRKLKKRKFGLTPYVYGTFRCSSFGITTGTEDTEYHGGKTTLFTDFSLAMMKEYKPGGIWYDEEKIPRFISNYSLTPESNKVNEHDSFYNELALLKHWKFGSGCYFIDEQRPSSSEDKR